jgi:hypothetical protein
MKSILRQKERLNGRRGISFTVLQTLALNEYKAVGPQPQFPFCRMGKTAVAARVVGGIREESTGQVP